MEEKKKSAIKQMVEGIVQIVVGIVGLIILAGVGSWFADSDDNQSTNTVATSTNVVETEDTVAETKNTSAKDIISNKKEYVINAAQSAVSKNLRSSSTARWGKTAIVDADNYGRYMVYVDLEAQNGFGGYEKCYFLVIVYNITEKSYYSNTYGGIKQLDYIYTEPYTKYVTQYDKQNPTPEIKTFLDTNDWNVAI